MRPNPGFTLIELMVVMGVAGILAAVAVPVFIESSARNSVWTASELIGAQIRQARLKLEVNGRGVYSSIGGAIPQTITVTYGQRHDPLPSQPPGRSPFETF